MPFKKLVLRGNGEAAPGESLYKRVLRARGISGDGESAFLDGDSFCDPFLIPGMERAVELLEAEIYADGLIVIYGDYDCDGVTATVLLYEYLEERGASVAYYIPEREDEGYGMNMAAVKAIKNNGAKLVITVDNGISAVNETAWLRQNGITVIITDHHTPPDTLPEADSIVSPKLLGGDRPFYDLSGVGVALKLVCALEGDCECTDTVLRFGALAALGTVADLVPLTNENRSIVRLGLSVINAGGNLGLMKLFEAAGQSFEAADSGSLAFLIAPRVNAASRVGDCHKAVELLLSGDEAEAGALAAVLEGYNVERRAVEGRIMDEITEKINREPQLLNRRVLTIHGENWHRGVIGICAAKLVERYQKPAVLISVSGGEGVGSARSIPGCSMIDMISDNSAVLTKFGGHAGAAGFSLKEADIGEFLNSLERWSIESLKALPLPEIAVDSELLPNEISLQSVSELERLAPFGMGNEQPRLLIRGAMLSELSATAHGRHVQLGLKVGGMGFRAIMFSAAAPLLPVLAGERCDIVVALSKNEYMGKERLSIRVQDIRPSALPQDEIINDLGILERFISGGELTAEEAKSITPSREELAAVYRAVKKGGLPGDMANAYMRLYSALSLGLGKVKIAILAFLESGLIDEKDGILYIIERQEKVDINSAPVLKRLNSLAG